MELDPRKKTILTAIIRTYLETGEPVGSRTISKYTDLNLSSATIRNEMSDLEEMGYILQPHTSAGRIPSDKGYRLYVDEIIKAKDREVEDMKEMMLERTDKLEKVLKQVVKILASKTNYASLITGPVYQQTRLKFIQLSKVSEDQLLAVIVADGNQIKNKIISVKEPLNDDAVIKLNLILNNELSGLTVADINLEMIGRLKKQAGPYSNVIDILVEEVSELIKSEEEVPIYTSGANNIFRYPELSDTDKASELISAFEEKRELADILNEPDAEVYHEETGIQVYIGRETSIKTMKDCSVVTANYDLGNGMRGTVGIIGPKRMDYENVVDNLNTLKRELDSIFHKEN